VQVHGGVNEVVAFSGTVQAGQVQGIKAARPMPARRPDQMTRFFTLPTAPAGRSLCEGDTLRTPVLFTAVTTGSRGRWTISHLLLRLAATRRCVAYPGQPRDAHIRRPSAWPVPLRGVSDGVKRGVRATREPNSR
jgi:hypothetical protein